MSVLNLRSRPTVAFDPANELHRRLYIGFLQNRCWTECPVQFNLERGYGDLVSMIEHKLAIHYLAQEFHNTLTERNLQWISA